MSPGSLQKWASGPEVEGMLMGVEFEMYVPGMGQGDYDGEPDLDADERVRDIDDIARFFEDTEGYSAVTRDLQRSYSDWRDDALNEYVSDNYDEDTVVERMKEEYPIEDFMDDARGQVEDEDDEADEDDIIARAEELQDEYIRDAIINDTRAFWSIREEYEEELMSDADISESDWLNSIGVIYASDAMNEFGLAWPYYTYSTGEANTEEVASMLRDTLDIPVKSSSNYHGAMRDRTNWIVEPDSSLDDPMEANDAGVEIVSPPLPVKEMLNQIMRIQKWAKSNGCYTNDTTGMHMNISVPNFSIERLDFIKLALFMGDQYVLEQFGRTSNSYCVAATKKIKQNINVTNSEQVLGLMRQQLNTAASKIIHSGRTDKYTSINTHAGYVEFRGPGDDWLDQPFDTLAATAIRLARALTIACDENAYKEEYAKKFYKLVAPMSSDNDTVALFAKYTSGELSKPELMSSLRQIQGNRNPKKQEVPSTTTRDEPRYIEPRPNEQSSQRWLITNTNQGGGSVVRWGRSGEEGRRELEDWARGFIPNANFTVEPYTGQEQTQRSTSGPSDVSNLAESQQEFLWQSRVRVKQNKYNGFIPVTVSAPDMRRARILIAAMYGVKDSDIGSTTKLPRK